MMRLLPLLLLQQLLHLAAAPAAAAAAAAALNFTFAVNWSSGGPDTTLPAAGFAVRKVEFIYYAPDRRTYAYADVINYTDPAYPESFGSEVGVFSSSDGRTSWLYHGIAIHRGALGGWDGGGVASPVRR